MAKTGLAYDMKEATDDMVRRRAGRTGDGSWQSVDHQINVQHDDSNNVDKKENPHEGELWGWDDKDMTFEEKSMVNISFKKTQ